jgi:alkyl hydroperoxide reductase subunit AhpF
MALNTLPTQQCDVEGALRAWVNAQGDICGAGKVLPNGVVLNEPRSPATGAIATVETISTGNASEKWHEAMVAFHVLAVGSRGGRGAAQKAAAALANKLPYASAVVVTTTAGEVVRILSIVDVIGPTLSGNIGGETEYRVQATVLAQRYP